MKRFLGINGLDGPYTQILIDSPPIFSALAGVYGLEQIPANMIDRVEVMRGGGSALFGLSAIAGTINIITKEPSRNSAQFSHILTGIGDASVFENNTTLNASLVSDNQKLGLAVFGQNRERAGYDYDEDGFTELPKLKNQTVGLCSYIKTGDYSKDWQGNLLLEGFYTNISDVFALTEIGQDENGVIINERGNERGGLMCVDVRWKANLPGAMSGKFRQDLLFLALLGTYTGDMLVEHRKGFIQENRTEKTADFFDLSLKAAYDFKLYKSINLQVNAGVQNIFNAYQSDFDKGADRDSGYMYGPGMPRSFYVGLKLSY